MKNIFYLFILFFFHSSILAQTRVEVEIEELFSDSNIRPVEISNANDGSNRLFVVDQNGKIFIWDGIQQLATPFLDIANQVACCNERGLLGLAFHPDYSNNGLFYVHYSNNSGNTVISQFVVSGNPNVADENSELIILTENQPFSNHNGGKIAFGPDGYLYIGLGDGGSANDPGNRAQNPQLLLGKILRIDIDTGAPYGSPPSNPFINDPNTLDEIWAIGVRNPWKFSFDKLTGDLWMGDVGQNAFEEINFQEASSSGGENYGWRCYEANNAFNTTGCAAQGNYDFPVSVYSHSFGCSVTGGYVYRGNGYPELQGQYLFIDYCTGNFWALSDDGQGVWEQHLFDISPVGFGWVSFGEDEDGELYLGNVDGTIYKIQKHTCAAFELNPIIEDGCEEALLQPNAANGFEPYSYEWSGGSTDGELIVTESGDYDVTVTDAIGCELMHTFNATVTQFPDVEILNLEAEYQNTDDPVALQGSPGGGTFSGPGVSNNIFDPGAAGVGGPYTIEYTVLHSGECEETVSQEVTVLLGTGIGDLDEIGYSVYPNPAFEKVFIEFNAELAGSSFDLMNQAGQVVFTDFLRNDIYELQTDFAKGLYFIKIYHDELVYIRKLLIF